MRTVADGIFVEFVVDKVDMYVGMLLGNLRERIGERGMVEAVAELLRKSGEDTQHHRKEHEEAFHFTVNTLSVSVMSICSKLLSCSTTSSRGSARFHSK